MTSKPHRWVAALMLIGISSLIHSVAFAQTPEETKAWEAQRAKTRADELLKLELLDKQRLARKSDPMAWVHTLDPMSQGGWVFRAVGSDGSWAVFSTDHQMKRSGRQVTLWLRQEYPEMQKSQGGDNYWSDVEKMQYDCAKERVRALLVIYYAENNLSGAQQSDEVDPKSVAWEAIVPGTQSEAIFQWACSTR
jgi:hypothetical protein